jgi:hypothetical protein
MQNYTCTACAAVHRDSRDQLHACYILEREEIVDITLQEEDELIHNCQLMNIDALDNLIPLCTTCRDYFQLQLMGIELVLPRNRYGKARHRWLVKKELASQRMPTGELYETIHHKKLQFSYPCQEPPPSLLRHRMHRYVHGISSKRPETKKKRKVRLLRCVCYSGRCPHLFHASVSIQLAQIEHEPRGMSFDSLRRRSLPQVAAGVPPRRSGVKAAKWWVLKKSRRLRYRREVGYQSRALRCEAAWRHGGTTATPALSSGWPPRQRRRPRSPFLPVEPLTTSTLSLVPET